MLTFNKEKTNELIIGLKDFGDKVTVEKIDQYLRTQGVLVKVHIGRARNYIEVNPKIFGVNIEKTEELSTFFKEYIKNGEMTFIPMSYEKKLGNIEQRVRTKRDRTAIGYNSEFMPIEVYKEFKIYVDKAREEYLSARDSVLEKWDKLIEDFKGILKNSLSEMNSLNQELIYEEIIKRLPSKEEYKNSFYMSISLKAFPVSENVDLFDESLSEEIKKSMIDDSVNSVYEIVENTLVDCFTIINKVLMSYEKNKDSDRGIAVKTLNSLSDATRRIRGKNIFKNAFIEEIAKNIENMYKLSDAGDIAEQAETTLALIYGYSEEMGFSLPLKTCVIDEEVLSLIYKAMKA